MNVAFIPVRGGSKSIPLKNIKPINGKPLVYWTVKAAVDCPEIDKVYVATEDGSAGTKGNVIDAIKANALDADVIYACGPTPMLRALKAYAQEQDIECWISMEERMACGIGACLACVCQSKEVDGHSHVHNKRVCKDGPVFRCDELDELPSEY